MYMKFRSRLISNWCKWLIEMLPIRGYCSNEVATIRSVKQIWGQVWKSSLRGMQAWMIHWVIHSGHSKHSLVYLHIPTIYTLNNRSQWIPYINHLLTMMLTWLPKIRTLPCTLDKNLKIWIWKRMVLRLGTNLNIIRAQCLLTFSIHKIPTQLLHIHMLWWVALIKTTQFK